jgi:hypothetical protein
MSGYLLVANQTLGGTALEEVVRDRVEREKKALLETPFELHVVVPATAMKDQEAASTGDAASVARQRLEDALERVRAIGVTATGEVGAEDPLQAVGDALASRPAYAEIIIFTLPRGVSKWLRTDLPHRVERRFDLKVTTIEAPEAPPVSGAAQEAAAARN